MAQTQGSTPEAAAPSGAVRFASLVIRVNAVLFAASAPVLLLAPGSMAAWLNIDSASADVRWAVQVIGACLLGLAGQLWIVSKCAAQVVMTATAVTFTAETVTTLLTALTPGSFTPMRWFFFGQGAVSALAYGCVLLWARQKSAAPHVAA
ncbi:MAG: hypothetical protein KGP01_03135 [Actinomycetales bacterium]|nr:hypothetical protein [Actinomycetales bacterium]